MGGADDGAPSPRPRRPGPARPARPMPGRGAMSGSSTSTSAAPAARARAIATRCRSPADSRSTSCPARWSSPSRRSSIAARRPASPSAIPRTASATTMFSVASGSPTGRAVARPRRPTSAKRRQRAAVARPAAVRSPRGARVGRLETGQHRSRVLLPAPDRPLTTVSRADRKPAVSESSTMREPKLTVDSDVSRAASPASAAAGPAVAGWAGAAGAPPASGGARPAVVPLVRARSAKPPSTSMAGGIRTQPPWPITPIPAAPPHLLGHPAIADPHRAVGDLDRAGVVADQHHRRACLMGELADQGVDAGRAGGVELAARLVCEQQPAGGGPAPHRRPPAAARPRTAGRAAIRPRRPARRRPASSPARAWRSRSGIPSSAGCRATICSQDRSGESARS